MTSFSFSWMACIFGFLFGAILCVIYSWLLWLTVKHLSKIQHKGLFLFVSAILRILLFIVPAILLSQNDVFRFLCIFVGFVLTRFVIVSQIKILSKEHK